MKILFALLPILFYSATSTTLVCTNGFTLVNNKCLRLFTNVVTHKVAENTCMTYGATLVTPKNAVENRAVTTFIGSSPSLVWIGVYCFSSDISACLWDDASGSVEPYNSFASGFPVVDIGKCVYYSTQGALAGKWLSGDCDNEPRAFVCELPATHADTCANNYNGYCYTLIPLSGFVAAQTSCEQLCGNLATIHSASENRYISILVNRNASTHVRIGAIQPKRNVFNWIDGTLWGYNNVDTSSDYADSCMVMSRGGPNPVPSGYWYSSTCTANYPSLCKVPAGTKCNGAPPPVTVTPIPSNPSYCNSSVLIAPGVITSPNYPGNYTNNLYCVYQLTTIGSYNVVLTFTDFYTENGRDIVSVYDGNVISTNSLIRQYSGSRGVFAVKSTGNNMMVTFTTDGSGVFRGFSARFTSS